MYVRYALAFLTAAAMGLTVFVVQSDVGRGLLGAVSKTNTSVSWCGQGSFCNTSYDLCCDGTSCQLDPGGGSGTCGFPSNTSASSEPQCVGVYEQCNPNVGGCCDGTSCQRSGTEYVCAPPSSEPSCGEEGDECFGFGDCCDGYACGADPNVCRWVGFGTDGGTGGIGTTGGDGGTGGSASSEPSDPVCGDGYPDGAGGETCDDSNIASGDGCSASCAVEDGYECSGEPSECTRIPFCGDGMIRSGEACDDSNKTSGDGCSASCLIEEGYICEGEPSECEISCGNGMIASDEACDDDNKVSGDGCSSSCSIEDGYECSGEPSTCVRKPACRDGIDNDGDGKVDHPSDPGCASPGDTNETDLPPQCAQKNESCATSSCCGSLVCDAAAKTCVDPYCGDGTTNGSEQCDDGKTDTETCDYDAGDTAGNGCTDRTCGDGYENEAAGEACDDGNDVDGDGCDRNCQEETCSDCARANGESGADEVMCGQLPGCFYQPFRWWLFWVPASCEKTDSCKEIPVNTCKAGCWKEESPGVCGPNPNSDLVAAVPTTWWGRLTGWVTGSSLTAEVVHYPESGCCCETDDLPDLDADDPEYDIGPDKTVDIWFSGINQGKGIAHDVLITVTLPPELSFDMNGEIEEGCRFIGERTAECAKGNVNSNTIDGADLPVRLTSSVPPCGTRIPISFAMSTSDQETDTSNNEGTAYAIVTCGARVCCTYSADNQESEPACSVRSTREACETPNSGAEAGSWVPDELSCSEYVCELPDLEVSIDGHTPVAQAVAAGVRNGFGFAVHNIGRGSADNVVIQATFSAPLRAEQLTGTVTGGTCTVNAPRTVITCIPNENKLKIEDVLSVDGGAFSLPAAASPMPQCNAPLDFTVTVTTSDVQFDTSNDTQTQAYVVNCGVCCPDPAVTLSCTQANHMPQSQCPSPRTWLAPNNTCSDCPGVEKPKQVCCIYEREPSFSREWNPVECRVAEKKTESSVFCHDVSSEPNVTSEWRTDISEEACRTESAYDVCGKGEVDLKLTKTLKSSDRPPVPGDVILYDLAVENRPIESVGDVTIPSDPAVDVTINDFSNPQLEFVPEQSDASCRKLLISGSVSCDVGTIAFRESKTVTIAFRLKERGTSGCTVTNSALVYADNKEVLMTNNYANAPLNAYCASGTRHCCAPTATSCTQVLLGEDGKCPAYKQGTLDTGYETASACDAACEEPVVEKFCCSTSNSCSKVALVEGKCPAPMKVGSAEGGYETQKSCDDACLPKHPCCMKIEVPGRINPEYLCGTEVSEKACKDRIGTTESTSFNTGKVVEVAYKPYVEQCQQTSCREAFIPKPCCSSGNVCELKLEHECKAAGNDVGTGYSCEDYDEACPKPTYCCSASGNTCVEKKVGGPACKQGSGPFSDRSCNDSCSPEPTYCCSASGNACIEKGDGSACAAGGKEYSGTPANCGGECAAVPSKADITITKTLVGHTPGVVRKPGDKIAYVITVTNHGEDQATGVKVTDLFPMRLLVTSMPSNCVDIPGLITCTDISVPAKRSVDITIQATVDEPPSICTSTYSITTNRVSVSASPQFDKNSSNNIADAYGFDVACPTWEVEKEMITSGPYTKGQTVKFRLSFKRVGGKYEPNGVGYDNDYFEDIGTYLDFVTLPPGCAVSDSGTNGRKLACQFPSVSKDATHVVEVTGTIKQTVCDAGNAGKFSNAVRVKRGRFGPSDKVLDTTSVDGSVDCRQAEVKYCCSDNKCVEKKEGVTCATTTEYPASPSDCGGACGGTPTYCCTTANQCDIRGATGVTCRDSNVLAAPNCNGSCPPAPPRFCCTEGANLCSPVVGGTSCKEGSVPGVDANCGGQCAPAPQKAFCCTAAANSCATERTLTNGKCPTPKAGASESGYATAASCESACNGGWRVIVTLETQGELLVGQKATFTVMVVRTGAAYDATTGSATVDITPDFVSDMEFSQQACVLNADGTGTCTLPSMSKDGNFDLTVTGVVAAGACAGDLGKINLVARTEGVEDSAPSDVKCDTGRGGCCAKNLLDDDMACNFNLSEDDCDDLPGQTWHAESCASKCGTVPVAACGVGCFPSLANGTCPADPDMFARAPTTAWGKLVAWLTGAPLKADLIDLLDVGGGCCCPPGGGTDGGGTGDSGGTGGGSQASVPASSAASSEPTEKQCGVCSGNSQTACENGPNACQWKGSVFGFVTVLFGGSSGTCSPEPQCLSGGTSSSSRDSGASESSAASDGGSSSSESSVDPIEYIWYVIGLTPFDAPACSDGEDNDSDGRIDRDDPGCYDALVAGGSPLSRLAAAVGLTIKPWGTYLPERDTELCDPGMFETEGKCVALPQCPARVGEAQQDRVNALLKCGTGCQGNSRCTGICACSCTASPEDAADAVEDVQMCFNTCLARTSHPICVPNTNGKTSQGLTPAECCRVQCVTARCGM